MKSALRLLLTLFTILCGTTISSASIQELHEGVGFEKSHGLEVETRFHAEFFAPDGVVYRRTDRTGNVKPYGGQAKSEARFIERQSEHARANPDSDFDFEVVGRAEPGDALDVLEHNTIQDMTGGVAAKKSPRVSNKKDPVGPARRPRLGLPEPKTTP